jgi:hypothetical protein
MAAAGISSGRAYEAALAAYRQASEDVAEAESNLKRLQAAVASWLPTRPPPTRPPPTGGGGPPPSNGKTVNPSELRSKILAMPRGNAVNEWGHNLAWKSTNPDMANTRYAVTNGNAILIHQGVGPNGILATKQPDHFAENIELDGLGKIRWGFMGYGVPVNWKYLYAHDIKEEHVDYNKNCWDTLITEAYAERVGSQFLQEVNRVQEMVDPSDVLDPNGNGLPSECVVEYSAMMDVGLPTGARPSYAISCFEGQGLPSGVEIFRNLTVRGCHIETWEHPNYQASGGLAYSFGAIMAHCYQKVAVLDTRCLLGMPDRAPIQIWDASEIWIIGGETHDHWYGKELWIDLRAKPGTKVVVQDHMGDWRATVCGGNFWDYAYKFQDQQIAPYLKYEHRSKVQGQSFEFVIP